MRVIILLIALWGLTACGEDNRNKLAVEQVIAEKVAERVANYRKNRLERCQEAAINEANTIADSLLLLEARLTRDTASKPLKPNKPEKPEIKILTDSTPIAPLIRRDSNQ